MPVYGYTLSPDKVLELLRNLPAASTVVHSDLERFTARLRGLMGMA